jgi:hypothetical protein
MARIRLLRVMAASARATTTVDAQSDPGVIISGGIFVTADPLRRG